MRRRWSRPRQFRLIKHRSKSTSPLSLCSRLLDICILINKTYTKLNYFAPIAGPGTAQPSQPRQGKPSKPSQGSEVPIGNPIPSPNTRYQYQVPIPVANSKFQFAVPSSQFQFPVPVPSAQFQMHYQVPVSVPVSGFKLRVQ